MSLLAVADMAENAALRRRLVAAVALEGIDNPDMWITRYQWQIVAADDWQTAWAGHRGSADPGGVESVITDDMILSRIRLIQNMNEGR